MKLVTYLREEADQLAILVDGLLYNTQDLHPQLPNNMQMFLLMWDEVIDIAMHADADLKAGKKTSSATGIPYESVEILAPVPFPTSCRDGYAFRQHVASARKNRGLDMIPEFDEYPIFYFTNHNAIQGPGNILCMPDHFDKLDFELEVAVVVCRPGRNIPAAEADEYIGGYMIMNDMSARTLQMEEMKLNLGPAKGKDFSTVIGPMLVTPDELEAFKVPAKPGHTGNAYDLKMTCRINGVQVSEGSMGDMDWTFAEIIERCSYGVNILPGDVIGSGTVGTGCFLELNGTGKRNDPNYQEQWLQPGDVMELEVAGLGSLQNTIIEEESDFSILALKKK
ncbi:fumarylacetoacetate hydrolase family protein [Chitinophaga pendula]|uniref:fumarylacetoacetate hydrolase family protein n=1 Tax=Chitinophaga TaxID=79328 RepID=UPI000BAF3279|nr:MULTISPECIES: fumarylacetoacetate hydrolase family protein [Chitinophaga]ASZ10097.1 fumarylacetoacetate hydrolase [Chitinophaga sp. MD30]UCJ06950.1 fumarylacetoacetate hydrolase family protein [Chitinophaga pendula]